MRERWQQAKARAQRREMLWAIGVTVALLAYAAARHGGAQEGADDSGLLKSLWFYVIPLGLWWISIAIRRFSRRE